MHLYFIFNLFDFIFVYVCNRNSNPKIKNWIKWYLIEFLIFGFVILIYNYYLLLLCSTININMQRYHPLETMSTYICILFHSWFRDASHDSVQEKIFQSSFNFYSRVHFLNQYCIQIVHYFSIIWFDWRKVQNQTDI